MAEPIGALRAELSANAAQFEADMKRARNAVRDSSTRMQKSMRALRKRFDAAVKGLFSFRSAAVAAAGATGLVYLTKRVADAANEIDDTAQKLGIGVEALQEYRYAAEQTGVAQKTLDMAIQRFTRRASEAANGTGEARAAIAELGIELRDSDGNMRSTEALLGDVADSFTQVKSPADRLRLAFKLFDSEGAGMVNMLSNGRDGLNDLRSEAQELGIVLSGSVIEQSQRFSDQMTRVEKILQAGLARNLNNLIPAITGIANAFIAALPHVKNFFDIINRNEIFRANRAISEAKDRVQDLREEFERATEVGSGGGVGSGFLGKSVSELRSSLETQKGELSDEAKEIKQELEAAEKELNDAIRRLGQLQRDRDQASRGDFVTDVPSATGADIDDPGDGSGKRDIDQRAINTAMANVREFERLIEQREQNVSDTIAGAIRAGAEDGADGMTRTLLRALQNKFINQAAVALTDLFSMSGLQGALSFGGGGGGGVSTIDTSGFAGKVSGSIAGQAHSGMTKIPREGTYMLDEGERVLSAKQNADLTKFLDKGRGSDVELHIHNEGNPVDVERTETSTTPDGRTVVEAWVVNKVNDMMARGQMDRGMGVNFGVRRRPTK